MDDRDRLTAVDPSVSWTKNQPSLRTVRKRGAGWTRAREGAPQARRSLPLTGLLLGALLACLLASRARAADLPDGFTETRIASGLDPTAFALAPDGRLFVTEKSGRIRIVKNDAVLGAPFATVQPDNFNEQGLIGITLDPGFAQNGYVYVVYTVPGDQKHNRVSRFTARGDTASGGETVIYELSRRSSGIHNGGSIAFGPDGKLYVGAGDDSFGQNAQSDETTHGKILRMNADGTAPPDNPGAGKEAPANVVWARGLRNPFNMAFQPGSGRLFINDVGQSTWEEINEAIPNANFGWPGIEGRRGGQPAPANYRDPVHAYPHQNWRCAITGGAFYNPATKVFPARYVGGFFFADYCDGAIRVLDPSTRAITPFASQIRRALSILVAPDGALYYIARSGIGDGSTQDNTGTNNGEIYRVRYTGSLAPLVSAQPEDVTVPAGQTASFTVAATGAAPLRYQWKRGGKDIPGADRATYTTGAVQPADSGARFTVEVRNAAGAVTSEPATLTVGTPNSAPVPVIAAPVVNQTYQAGQVLQLAGSATDREDGTLPPSALTWWIDFHHDVHTHPAMPATNGARASYEIPRTVETASNVWYRVYLRATDSRGRQVTVHRDVQPQRSTFTLATTPPGLTVLLGGQPVDTPLTVTGVVGVARNIEAPAAQSADGVAYEFAGWSDGGARQHTIYTDATPQTYTARYVATGGQVDINRGLHGTYFNNPTLSGAPVLTRREAVDFDFERDPPAPGVIGPDHFSVRWTGEVEATVTGAHVFSTISDDGIRLWVDGKLLIDRFYPRPRTVDTASPINLEAGRRYAIKVEYFEHTGIAEAHLRWSYPGVAATPIPATQLFAPVGTGLEGTYYGSMRPDGKPLLTRLEAVDFLWGSASPAPGTVPADGFSVRWRGQIEAPTSGNVVFSTLSDDGIRVWLDGRLLIDNLTDHGSTIDVAAPVTLRAGQHYAIDIEYYDRSNAAEAHLRWAYASIVATPVPKSHLFPPAGDGLTGAYFTDRNLTSPAVLTQTEAVDFAWGTASPAPGLLGADDFSVRWTGEVEAPVTGAYVFTTVSDDGIRLWINGRLVIDKFAVHPRQVDDAAPIELTAGQRYAVKLEYFEGTGAAEARLLWRYPGIKTGPVPEDRLFPIALSRP